LLVALLVVLAPCMAPDADAGARRSRPLRTGQVTCTDTTGTLIPCAGTGQDGDLQRGEPRAYLDQGDGTIRDKRTALTWEKLSDDGTIHDKDNTYTWAEAFGKIDDLNTMAFAGFTDWRLPSLNELETIRDVGVTDPAVPAIFHTGCVDGCTVLTCSCTRSTFYWTSTPYVVSGNLAWVVTFYDGYAYRDTKGGADWVRAVRGGS
jgi:hypothetical protein